MKKLSITENYFPTKKLASSFPPAKGYIIYEAYTLKLNYETYFSWHSDKEVEREREHEMILHLCSNLQHFLFIVCIYIYTNIFI